jgi:hypothetical protein
LLHGGPQTVVLFLVLYQFFTSFSVNSELPSPDYYESSFVHISFRVA